MEEIWKDVPDYEGVYVASNLGRIKRLEGYVYKGKTRAKTINHEKILVPVDNGNGYKKVQLCNNSVNRVLYIHQIIAMTFLNHKPDKFKFVVNHINFDKSDNRVLNLEVVTNRENSNKRQFTYTSSYSGVCWDKRMEKWKSYIKVNGVTTHLGYFENEHKAGEAYKNKLHEITK